MLTSFLGFLMMLGCIGIGIMVLIYGLQFLLVIMVALGAGIAIIVQWLKEQFK